MEQQPHVNSGGEATCGVGGQAHLCACVGRRCPPGAPLAVCFTVTYCFGELRAPLCTTAWVKQSTGFGGAGVYTVLNVPFNKQRSVRTTGS